jgi:hypothetical protein
MVLEFITALKERGVGKHCGHGKDVKFPKLFGLVKSSSYPRFLGTWLQLHMYFIGLIYIGKDF